MSISTMSARPRGVGLGGGWLSMAPQLDDAPVQPQPVGTVEQRPDSNHASPSVPASAQRSPIVPPPRAMNTAAATRSNQIRQASQSYSQAPQTLIRKPYSAQSQPDYGRLPNALPRTKARFSVGDSTSQPATPASVTPPSPPLSQDGNGDGQDSPPAFDVRNSFAPMRWGTAGPTISSRRNSAAQDGKAGNRLVQGGGAIDQGTEGSVGNQATQLSGEEEDDEDDGERFEYAGRKWKGKTAQAIELEMEALGDRTVMSYAPDAVYLASRLEGLRRNLEAGGERFRRRWWEDLEEEGQDAQMDSVEEEHVQRSASNSALDGSAAQPLSSSRRSSAHLSLAMSSPVRDMHIIDPLQDAATATTDSAALDSVAQEHAIPSQSADHGHATDIDPVAKQAALDARVEIRTLRRPDLEQVRELHCYHGDGDKVDTETYTTSAAFLLRLLVDEHYVCLVAVAKPLPEPPALPPSTLAPRPPPPSLDMPASRAPFMLAGRPNLASATASNGFAQRSALNKRAVSALPAFLAPTTNADILMHDAPAPRSFGAGPDSSENTSSLLDSSDEEEEERVRLGSVQAASTLVTGNTSPPLNDLSDGKDDVSMPDIAEEEEVDEVAVSETENGVNAASPAGTAAALSMRKASTVTNRPSPRSILAGPTFDVAPPRAIRVMGAPPLNGMPLESETILGVASARIKVVQRAADDFHLQASEWKAKEAAANGSADMERSSSKDASWPGLDPKGERSVVTREAHIMTLSVLPEERGQGLGARLLDRLLDECRRRTAGPRIHLAPGSNTTTEDASGEAAAPPRAHQDAPMRTVLEMHPSNTAAVQLYNARKFRQVSGNRGVVKHFFRGDQRIPSSIRLKVGGSDAVRMERIDLSTG